jgi:hypothetical protein
MKEKSKMLLVAFAVVLSFWMIPVLYAAPLDLSGFTAAEDPFVQVNAVGEVSFTESKSYSSLDFYNDNFLVTSDATRLSFNYDFALGVNDQGDYLLFEVEFTPILEVDATISGGYFAYDLSSFRNQEISLAWSLQWDEDSAMGTTAKIYNIELDSQQTAPIPEPSTYILVGMGLFGLAGMGRRRYGL